MAKIVEEASKLVTISGFRASLEKNLERFATELPIAVTDRLASKLAGGTFTYMTIESPTDAEVVKAYLFDGRILLERGQDDTVPTAFPKGSCVDADPTWAGIKELVCTFDCCAVGHCPEPDPAEG